MKPLIYQFYIRDLNKFESNVIVLLEQYGYRVESLDYESMILGKSNIIQSLFTTSVLSKRNRIFIDYSDNLVSLRLERKPFFFKGGNKSKDEKIWNNFFSWVIHTLQIECSSPIFTEKVQKKDVLEYL